MGSPDAQMGCPEGTKVGSEQVGSEQVDSVRAADIQLVAVPASGDSYREAATAIQARAMAPAAESLIAIKRPREDSDRVGSSRAAPR